ncbi:MAG: adenosine deaminase [Xanthomonadales bacterium]|nr:adenosine deaminase [Xanthomonadales bacterium]
MIEPSLPLIDLHRHLDGNVRLSTILELASEHGIELPGNDLESLRPHVEIDDSEPGLMAFIARFRYLTAVLVDYDACRRVARENVLDLADQGIDYAELRFSPWFMAETHGLDPSELCAAVIDGVAQGRRETGIPCQLIGILSRHYGPEICRQELRAMLDHKDGFVALDLAGDEANFPASLFREHFRQARDAGWQVTVHAGEADGAASVWSAIRDLGATRIGHGIRSIEDPDLIDFIAEKEIGLEVCLTSNVHTSTVTDLASHPVRRLLDAGVVANLNTDDPAISGIDLRHEFEMAAPAAGLSAEHTRKAQANALEMAFISPGQRRQMVQSRVEANP